MTSKAKGGKKSQKKYYLYLVALVLVAALVGAGFYYYEQQRALHQEAKNELQEFENVEAEIFDLGDSFRVGSDDQDDVPESIKRLGNLTIEDLKNDDDFLYQVLIQNQLDINKLNSHMRLIELELKRFKSQAKLQKLIMTYVNLRENIFTSRPYKDQMQNFRLLSIDNKILMDNVRLLQDLAPDFKSFDDLSKQLQDISKTLIAMKKNDPKGSFVERVRFNIAKVVTIRKLDGQSDEIDGAIFRLQNALQNNDCDQSGREIAKFAQRYQEAIATLKSDLEKSCQLRKVDDEIMLYLENLSLVN